MTKDKKELENFVNNAVKTLDEYFKRKRKTNEVMQAITAYQDLIFVSDLYLKSLEKGK